MPGCKPLRALLGWRDKQGRYLVHGAFPSAFRNWTRCSAGAFLKAIVSWWQGLRGRENRFWQPNSLLRAYARAIQELWWSLKNDRKSMRSGPAVLVWI